MSHTSIRQLLLEFVARILKSLARSLKIVYTYASVSKSSIWLRISCRNLVIWVIFCAVVVCEFNKTFAVTSVVAVRSSLGRIVAQKVKVKIGIFLFELANHFHA